MDIEGALDLPERWSDLFGVGGVLAKGRRVGVGRFVRELRFGDDLVHTHGLNALEVTELALPACSSLSLQPTKNNRPAVSRIVTQLPLTKMSLFHNRPYLQTLKSFPCDSFCTRLSDVVGFHPQPLAWRNLERLTFRNVLWYDYVGRFRRRLSLSDWSFKVFVFEAEPEFTEAAEMAFALFLDPLAKDEGGDADDGDEDENEREGEVFLPNVELIEFRIKGGCAKEVEQKFRDDAARRRARGLNEVEKRLLPMMVFVGKDGKDRRILEE